MAGAAAVWASSACAFTGLGALAAALFTARLGLVAPDGFYLRCGVKSGAFLAVALGLLYFGGRVVQRQSLGQLSAGLSISLQRPWRNRIVAFLLLFLLVLALAPRLGKTPFPETDETHHLLAARNFAFYGTYASGHPEIGFNVFDPWDSVGTPVLVPVAWVYRWSGRASLAGARVLSVLWFALLCWQVHRLMAPFFGGFAAALSCLLLTALPGTVYLARTVYGEIPGLALFLLSLNALACAARWPFPVYVTGGVFFGLALLAKPTFILMSVPLSAALCFQFLSGVPRTVHRALGMAAGTLAVLLAWMLLERTVRAGAEAQPGAMFALYRPFLLFGLEGLPKTLPLLFGSLFCILVLGFALVWAWPRVIAQPAIGPLTVLFAALFHGFWFLFFTAGNLYRYLWPALALAVLFAGPALAWACQQALCRGSQNRRSLRRCAAAAVVVIAAAGFAIPSLTVEMRRILFEDATQSLRQLAGYVGALPEGTRIAATHWPLQRSIDLLTGRHVAPASSAEGRKAFGVVIGLASELDTPAHTWPPYAVSYEEPKP